MISAVAASSRALIALAFLVAGYRALRDRWRGPRVGAAFGCLVAAGLITCDGFWLGVF